jgi:hypothetical protein
MLKGKIPWKDPLMSFKVKCPFKSCKLKFEGSFQVKCLHGKDRWGIFQEVFPCNIIDSSSFMNFRQLGLILEYGVTPEFKSVKN